MSVLRPLKKTLRRFVGSRLGPTITEYAVLLALVAFSAATAMSLIGTFVGNSMRTVAEAIPGSGEDAASSQSNANNSGQKGKAGGKKSKATRKPKPKKGRRAKKAK